MILERSQCSRFLGVALTNAEQMERMLSRFQPPVYCRMFIVPCFLRLLAVARQVISLPR